jgi:hypothetical protein
VVLPVVTTAQILADIFGASNLQRLSKLTGGLLGVYIYVYILSIWERAVNIEKSAPDLSYNCAMTRGVTGNSGSMETSLN